MAGRRTWVCRYCGARILWPAASWPPTTQEKNGHFHRWERSRPGRPPKEPTEEAPAASVFGYEVVDVDELEGARGLTALVPTSERKR